MNTEKARPRLIQKEDHLRASLTDTTWAVRWKTPRSRAKRSKTRAMKPAYIQSIRTGSLHNRLLCRRLRLPSAPSFQRSPVRERLHGTADHARGPLSRAPDRDFGLCVGVLDHNE